MRDLCPPGGISGVLTGMRIAKTSLHLEAAERIRELIVEGDLPPGSRIPERELCEQFGISRTPLREALKVLASEGLISLTQNRGARVVKLSRQDIEDTFQVMEALEALAGELACSRITDEELADVRALHYQMLAHFERNEMADYIRINQAIHEAIITAARNPVLSQMYEGLSGRVQRSRYRATMSRNRWRESLQEHEEILDALTARDSKRLAHVLSEHIEHKLEVLSTSSMVSPGEEADMDEDYRPGAAGG